MLIVAQDRNGGVAPSHGGPHFASWSRVQATILSFRVGNRPSVTGRLSWTKAREYWEKRPLLLLVVIVLTLGTPFLGLFLAGWIGVVVGLVVSIATFAGRLFAISRVREITRPQ